MKTLGQIAYDAGMVVIFKHVDMEGVEPSSWDGLGTVKRKAWEAAALAAVEAVKELGEPCPCPTL